jgi:hypothetical protein
MTRADRRLTSVETILLAASDLSVADRSEFSEWELSVAAWQRDKSRFGMRGFESEHPDHKRVMKEIMGKAPANPVSRGYLQKTRPNFYQLTPVGRAEVAQLVNTHKMDGERPRAASDLYDGISRFTSHRVFVSWLKDPDEPRTWLGASAFLGLTQNEPQQLNNAIRAPVRFASDGLAWLKENNRDQLWRGPAGGGKAITRAELEKLSAFVNVIQERFGVQIAAILRRGDQPGHR